MNDFTVKQLLLKYEAWFWKNLERSSLSILDSIITYNTVKLLKFNLNESQHTFICELESHIDKLKVEDVIHMPKFQIMLYSYLRNNPAIEITIFIKDWIEYLYLTNYCSEDFSFPYYFFHSTPQNCKLDYMEKCKDNTFKSVLSLKNSEQTNYMDNNVLIHLKAILILHFQKNNFVVGNDLLKILLALKMRDYITESCVNKLLLNFNIEGYFGLYQKNSFTITEKRNILYRTLDTFIVLLEYNNQISYLEKKVFNFHLK